MIVVGMQTFERLRRHHTKDCPCGTCVLYGPTFRLGRPDWEPVMPLAVQAGCQCEACAAWRAE